MCLVATILVVLWKSKCPSEVWRQFRLHYMRVLLIQWGSRHSRVPMAQAWGQDMNLGWLLPVPPSLRACLTEMLRWLTSNF